MRRDACAGVGSRACTHRFDAVLMLLLWRSTAGAGTADESVMNSLWRVVMAGRGNCLSLVIGCLAGYCAITCVLVLLWISCSGVTLLFRTVFLWLFKLSR